MSNSRNRITAPKPGPKRRPIVTLKQKQQDERLKERFDEFFNSLKAENLAEDEVASHLYRVMYPVITLLKKKWLAQRNNPKQRRFSDVHKERILLAKMESLQSNLRYKVFRWLSLIKQLPSLKTIEKVKKKLDITIRKALGINTRKKLVSCYVSMDKCLNFMLRFHLSAFGAGSVPKDIILKFSSDGRPNEGHSEVLIGLIPVNLLFAEQSGYSVFPIEVLRGSESDAKPHVQSHLKKLLKMENEPYRFEDNDYNIKVVVCMDFASFWSATGLTNMGDDNEFCPKCHEKNGNIRLSCQAPLRDTLPGLGISSKRYIYCSLHAGMRMTESITNGILTPISAKKELNRFITNAAKCGVRATISTEENARPQISMTGNGVKMALSTEDDFTEEGELKFSAVKERHESTKARTPWMETMLSFVKKEKLETKQSFDKKKEEIAKLMNEWSAIYLLISLQRDLTVEELDLLGKLIESIRPRWVDRFPTLLTNYAHVVFAHTMDILQEWKSIGRYSQQGFEYANRLHRGIEERASNHGGGVGETTVPEQLIYHFYGRCELAIKLNCIALLKKMFRRKDSATVPPIKQYNPSVIDTPPTQVSRDFRRSLRRTIAMPQQSNVSSNDQQLTPNTTRMILQNLTEFEEATYAKETRVEPSDDDCIILDDSPSNVLEEQVSANCDGRQDPAIECIFSGCDSFFNNEDQPELTLNSNAIDI